MTTERHQDVIDVLAIEGALHRMYLAEDLFRRGHLGYGAQLFGTSRDELLYFKRKIGEQNGKHTNNG